MKTEDFERLKAICEKEGFGIQHFHTEETYHIWKKDIWDGVEFALNPKGFVRKIEKIEHGLIYFIGDFWYHKNVCKPSTEQAYIEQLKKEAHGRFGEIKDGDRFEFIGGIPERYQIGSFWKPVWNYRKDKDWLTFSGYTIYKKGKWAERVKGRVDVEFADYSWEREIGKKPVLTLQFFAPPLMNVSDDCQFITSQLEKIFNNE